MRTLLAAAALSTMLALAAPAQASTLSHFRVKDTGADIRFSVTVCGSGHVDFKTYLHTDRGVRPTYTAEARGGYNRGCTRWIVRMQDQYAQGIWDAWMKVYLRGRAYRTPTLGVYIT